MNYTFAEVAQHNTEHDVIDGKIYEVTKFLVEHPEARNSLLHYAGKDATIPFYKTFARWNRRTNVINVRRNTQVNFLISN